RAVRRDSIATGVVGRFAASEPLKTCPECAESGFATAGFCANCAASLTHVIASYPAPTRSDHIALPEYLNRARKPRRRPDEQGTGGGLVISGMIALGVAVLMGGDSSFRRGAWIGGLLFAGLGFWQMRRDPRTMHRAGAFVSTGSLLALTMVAIQLFGLPDFSRFRGATLPPPQSTLPSNWSEVASTPESRVVVRSSGEVPMYRGDARHTGRQPGPAPVGNPTLAWRVDTEGEIYSSPAVVDGVLYIGSKNGLLYAIDAESGEVRWQASIGQYIVRASPAVVDGTVYVPSGFFLYALDAENGEERWRLPIRFAGQSSPAIAEETVVFASQEGELYAVDATSGEEIWDYVPDGLILSSPAIARGMVFIGTAHEESAVIALDLRNGRTLWKFEPIGEVVSSPAMAGDLVYVSSSDGFTYALNTDDGETRWRYGVGGGASPAVVDGTVYIGGADGGLYALAAATGTIKWLFATGSQIGSSPAVAGDTVFLGSGRTLYAVDANTGQRRWHYAAGDDIESSPAVVDGKVFFGSRDGFIYALGGDGVTVGTPISAP
ncbi:MAG: PQQ-binding-like beta-propeller repeat protein, partial [Chloroflexota bacterium]|nr:PQQ-binding-like beta-propeller repeat protein [Chloroflexota bacterium]